MHSVMNYEAIAKANARQRVALEVLSFHASSSSEEAERVMVKSHCITLYYMCHVYFMICCVFILDKSITSKCADSHT